MKVSTIVATGVFSLAAVGVSAQATNDAQIAAFVVTANQVDTTAGKLAASTSKNAQVKAFAQRMVTDHTSGTTSATELVTRLKVTPEDNPTSQSLKSGGEANVANLKTLKGIAFDKAYIDQEVTFHQQVIEALDKTLIPGASNEELKAMLVKARPTFVSHLEHAKKVQASVNKATS
jgi:putative membrane protein